MYSVVYNLQAGGERKCMETKQVSFYKIVQVHSIHHGVDQKGLEKEFWPNQWPLFFLTLAGKRHSASFPKIISHASHACFPNPTCPTERDIPETKQKEAILYCQKMSYKGTPNTHQKDAKKQ